ncbi:hypothetical protein NE237_001191 [Protea cynaroides]|uniref:PA domain-containing protein n=1 Tax=Protea cynaroides TaxID=273540 RepID=A0A9Q0KSU9_9MAGN|nr:hypothetical protein NE237_001191 [Protea cynaroides]
MAIIRKFIALSLLSTLLIASVYPQFVKEKNSITVLSPDHLRASYDSSIGNFGNLNQAGTITGSLVYPKKGSNSNGCKSFDGENTFSSPSSRPTILLLDRGDCYFSVKVWNGQKGGAAAVLVADNVYEPLVSKESSSSGNGTTANKEKITIPSAFINRSLGENLLKALQKGEAVVIKIEWTGSSTPNINV